MWSTYWTDSLGYACPQPMKSQSWLTTNFSTELHNLYSLLCCNKIKHIWNIHYLRMSYCKTSRSKLSHLKLNSFPLVKLCDRLANLLSKAWFDTHTVQHDYLSISIFFYYIKTKSRLSDCLSALFPARTLLRGFSTHRCHICSIWSARLCRSWRASLKGSNRCRSLPTSLSEPGCTRFFAKSSATFL